MPTAIEHRSCGTVTIKFDLNDLQAFRAVAENGSFRRAAERIRITQPALSRRIDKLESALNVKLFERTTRKVALTTVGQAFMPQVERMLDDLDLALMSIGDAGSSRMGTVTVACVPSAAYYFMPQAIHGLHQLFPKIRIRLFDGSASHVSAAVASGEADFGVSFSGNLAPEVEFEPLLQERYVIACRHDHPLSRREQVSWQEAYGHDYITLDKTSGNRLAPIGRCLPLRRTGPASAKPAMSPPCSGWWKQASALPRFLRSQCPPARIRCWRRCRWSNRRWCVMSGCSNAVDAR